MNSAYKYYPDIKDLGGGKAQSGLHDRGGGGTPADDRPAPSEAGRETGGLSSSTSDR